VIVEGRRCLILMLLCVTFLGVTRTVLAHDARPLSIMITEQQEHAYRVDVRIPPSVERGNPPEILWPEGCVVRSHNSKTAGETWTESILVTCPEGLESQNIRIQYTVFNPSLSTLFRFSSAAGNTLSAVLAPDQSEWKVPPSPNWRSVAHDYLFLGIKHIWEGIDHLLFVAGLLMLARTPRRIGLAVTGFTFAHSITLSLSALGVVRLPVPPIEVGIALSILFLAREIALPDPESIARRYPLAISSSFGLLHGFGFAAALSEAGLPRTEIVPALLFFNLGVEVGQLAFIGCLVLLVAGLLSFSRIAGMHPSQWPWWRGEVFAGYVLGLPAAFWFLQRFQSFWVR